MASPSEDHFGRSFRFFVLHVKNSVLRYRRGLNKNKLSRLLKMINSVK
jgi:hypothetical protein